MRKSEMATQRQIRTLAGFNISAPPTKSMCHRYLSYILSGNGAGEMNDKNGRAGLLRAAKTEWENRIVRSIRHNQDVMVKYVLPKTARGGQGRSPGCESKGFRSAKCQSVLPCLRCHGSGAFAPDDRAREFGEKDRVRSG